jgi:hypothetical protein
MLGGGVLKGRGPWQNLKRSKRLPMLWPEEAEGSVAPKESSGATTRVLQQVAACDASGPGQCCSIIDNDGSRGVCGHGSVGYMR